MGLRRSLSDGDTRVRPLPDREIRPSLQKNGNQMVMVMVMVMVMAL